jgi:hypothetical protein
MAILSMALILGVIIMGSCSAQTSTNYLKVKGQIVNDHTADIYLYAQSEEDGAWEQVKRKNRKNRYSFKLSTDVEYQIIFVGVSGPNKVIHVKSGNPGTFIEYVDIDFNKNNGKHATLSPVPNDRYKFITSLEYTSSLN